MNKQLKQYPKNKKTPANKGLNQIKRACRQKNTPASSA